MGGSVQYLSIQPGGLASIIQGKPPCIICQPSPEPSGQEHLAHAGRGECNGLTMCWLVTLLAPNFMLDVKAVRYMCTHHNCDSFSSHHHIGPAEIKGGLPMLFAYQGNMQDLSDHLVSETMHHG